MEHAVHAAKPQLVKSRAGGWLPRDPAHTAAWIARLRDAAKGQDLADVPPIADFRAMVESDQTLYNLAQAMFAQAYQLAPTTPLGQPSVETFDEFLTLLNLIMTTAPEAYQDIASQQPAGLIGFPINALLDWPMATEPGYTFFSNAVVNQLFKRILAYWSQFLTSPASRYVLTEQPYPVSPTTEAVAWLSMAAQQEMVQVAMSALGDGANPTPDRFQSIFNCIPGAQYLGFSSWDDFFTRTFRTGVRPVSAPGDDSVIANACESAPLQVVNNVSASAQFWIKGQPYSLGDILAFDDLAPQFTGGTIYQAFLSALSYHRWHSPVSGTVVKAYVVGGSYYLENLYEGFANPGGADPSAPNDSQPFLTAVATRGVIFIQADNPAIGLMAVIPVGMAEVSSCEITVKPGDRVTKGDQIGMFHFGGSTHCLVFRPGVNLDFHFYGQTPGLDAINMRVNTALATVL
ncbi:phosphatidylserine decarboxylase family protein [Ciceribacter sp. L1K23]|uniref:phosphatidylserine decarboxylase family protein n=1 Tax=Ciceribacter sp. L1K23 TaxID=2820276 RepID=UPI001B816A4A|nr:phosphatidylserine decarboxylase family protein [Ciceribacter sp. L1K23]MBR0555550.1 phosphatidylserine decarboxylase family protein [Ciceribacter sp. L1K23]